ncbi:hypothetical protein F3K40_22450 [Streptomyces sp. LBUM 1478]|uniref:Secreted protein n=3 Tax=Streptomyces TaxID=1883 RepID=C9ZGS0_STRSW|nr:hypothetical protein [Streptomyces scabiei]MBP5861546.1 hypothetical protein [Streptomyces sp. LBUM 1484]MBP5878015.1 hypothetical protein [Streptomyces sp. LBUM 1477]MBP5885850.1 hypothetical protein [Streptomyces sp. LBUM 1487]MBP5891314.1 hypothetical protein [Streptomyces sp. LBUM 1481]MBP5901824.1 hypothetical protein [Streptomyces sp. LBUM 1488]MBP5907943.1 hypothetical protein [Streptomyces sp. LBUM 1478]MBP5914528.1 hypothetical protein [Streptomyces sp. LBUM 1486]MBP5921470.1 hy
MTSVMRKIACFAGVGAAVAAMSLSGASAAQAEAPTQGCPYPWVCFYVDNDALIAGRPLSKYQDVTSGYQAVTPRPHYGVLNTRNDDVVYLRLQSGGSICLGPNSQTVFANAYVVNGIRISSSSRC